MAYWDKEDGYKFMELKDDDEFRADLIRFFTGGRYNYSEKEVEEKGWDGLANDFVEHMRWQSTNEATAIFDVSYVQNEKYDPKGKEAFGRLMEAFDNSDGGGTGFIAGVGDYAKAFAYAPSTWATVGTMGFGVGSKLVARGTTAASQAAVRQLLFHKLGKEATREAAVALVRKGAKETGGALGRQMLRETSKSVLGQAARSAATTAALGAPLNAAVNYSMGKTREWTSPTGKEYTAPMFLTDTAIATVFGAAIGGAAGAWNQKARNAAFDTLVVQVQRQQEIQKAARAKSTATLRAARQTGSADVDKTMREVIRSLVPLSEEDVADGGKAKVASIFDLVQKGDDVPIQINETLSSDTIRNITAAKIDLERAMMTLDMSEVTAGSTVAEGRSAIKKITMADLEAAGTPLAPRPEGMRVTEWVSRAIDDGTIDGEFFAELRTKYGLTREQQSLIFLSDFSEAGRHLAEASVLSKQMTAIEAERLEAMTRSMANLYGRGMSYIPPEFLSELTDELSSGSGNVSTRIMQFANRLDAAQVAMMTTQVGTTVANLFGTGFNIFMDSSDQAVRGAYRSFLVGDIESGFRAFRGSTDIVRSTVWDRAAVEALDNSLKVDMPKVHAQLFHDTLRVEKAAGVGGRMVRWARNLNFLNAITDAEIKRHMMYVNLNRLLRENPIEYRENGVTRVIGSVEEWRKSGSSLDVLPDSYINRSIDETLRVTMQRGFTGQKDGFGKLAVKVEDIHRKTPFIISQIVGLPFPRYVANHLEFAADYTGWSLAYGLTDKMLRETGFDGFAGTAARTSRGVVSGPPRKTMEDRAVRAFTGWSSIGVGMIAYGERDRDDVNYTTMFFGNGEEGGGWDVTRPAGWFLFNMRLGELASEYFDNDGKVKEQSFARLAKEFFDIGTGVNLDMGVNTGLAGHLMDYAENPDEFNLDKVEKSFGRWIGVFSYPIANVGDVYDQLHPEAAGTPYTGNLLLDHHMTLKSTRVWQEATKRVPDLKMFQLFKTAGVGDYDIPTYSAFYEDPVGSHNPSAKAIGMSANPRPTAISKELIRLGLKEWDVYGTDNYNRALEYGVKELLSGTLSKKFEWWRKDVNLGNEYGGFTYDQLTSEADKKAALIDFVRAEKAEATNIITQFVTSALDDDEGNVRKYMAYVNNEWAAVKRELSRKSPEAIQRIVDQLPGGEGMDPDEYVMSFEEPQAIAQAKWRIIQMLNETGLSNSYVE